MAARPIPWLEEEDQVLRLAYGKLPTADLARMLERSANAVGQRAQRLGLVHDVRWTRAQDRMLQQRYADEATADIARDLGRTMTSTYNRANALGLSKSETFYASDRSARIKRGVAPGAIRHQFPKGHVPFNKGLRRPGWSPGRMAETQFQKGRPASAAHNYVPIGTEKYDIKRKVIVRKLTDDPTLAPVMRWRPVHVIVWEAVNGTVPKGHIVRFKKGLKTLVSTEITIDKLEIVTLAENMKLNSYHNNYPKEVGLAIQARGALQRMINKRNKQA